MNELFLLFVAEHSIGLLGRGRNIGRLGSSQLLGRHGQKKPARVGSCSPRSIARGVAGVVSYL